jgi:tetratricopeptide (TPR) repeat protein
VLDAVGHAHANLIVHRDLKPSNIFVTADGTVKLLDFGIAKLLDTERSDEHTLTVDGGRAFSLYYAAPEQVRGDTVTTGTDVYALGVLLYTLLAGTHPFDFRGQPTAEIERIIREDNPPRPSAAVPIVGDIAQAGAAPTRFGRRVRGDLDAIVMKALRKEPERRYASTAALADDLRRYLDGRAVLARPDTAWYRVRKFVGRNRTGVAVATVLAVLLVGFALRERTLRARSDAEARRTAAVEHYLESIFDVSNPEDQTGARADQITARALLDRGAARIDSELTNQPDVRSEMQYVLGVVYDKLGLSEQSVRLEQAALRSRRAQYGARNLLVAELEARVGVSLVRLNRFDEAEPLLREALGQRRALAGNADTATAASIADLGYLALQRSQYTPAESLYREALGVYRRALGHDHDDAIETQVALGTVLSIRGDAKDAEPLLRDALATRQRRSGLDDPTGIRWRLALAQALQQLARYREADTLYRAVLVSARARLGERHPTVAIILGNLGNMLARQMGKPDEAEPLVREALEIDRTHGARTNLVAGDLDNLGAVLRAKGDLDGAEASFREAVEIGREINGPTHRIPARAFANLAGVRHIRGDTAGVLPMLREARSQMATILGKHQSSVTTATIYLAQHLRERGKVAEADSIFRDLDGWLDSTKAPERTQFFTARLGLGQALTDRGRVGEAVPLLESALAARTAEFGATDWRPAEAGMALGVALLARGDRARAEPLLRDAATAMQRYRRVQPRIAREADVALQRASR